MSTKRSRVRQWISVLLIVGMLVTALPTVAYADTEGAATPASPTSLSTMQSNNTNTKSFDAVQSAIVRKGKYSNEVQGLSGGSLVLKNCGDNSNYTREGYIQFDTSDDTINTDNITQVKLVLYAFQQKAVNPADIKLKVNAVNYEEWVAAEITAADADTYSYAGEELATNQAVGTQYGVNMFNVTSYAKSKWSSESGNGKISFLLSSAVTDSYAEIYVASQQIPDQQYAPKLIITYRENSSSSGNVSGGDDNPDDPITNPEFGDDEISFKDNEEKWDADQKDKLLRQATMEGSGTVSDPYLIYTAEDLMSMTENDNKCYKLMRDIDLKGKKWRPVGYYYWYPFMGYLDGNGHKITNLYVGGSGEDAWDISAGGLFGYLEGRVENLGVETYDAKREGIDFAGYAGGIAGVAIAPAEIVNCYFNGRVAGAYSIGGIVGIAYPGTIIENCCALGSVDMSELFFYRNDNVMEYGKQLFDTVMTLALYVAQTTNNITESVLTANIPGVVGSAINFFFGIPDMVKKIESMSIVTAQRKTNMGGLVGLNYGTIKNSYAANRLYGDASKVGAIAARNIEVSDGTLNNDGALVQNCYYDQNVTRDDDGDKTGYSGTTKYALRSVDGNALKFVDSDSLTGKKEVQWDFSAKTLANKSTGGYPLPKTYRIARWTRTVTETKEGEKTTREVEPEVYYNSRVLMRTRESYFLSSRTTNAGSLVCSICEKLGKTSKHKAVTGIYQRGSIAHPYHVHDLESLIAMQDYKESHFILCDDIDFLVSDGVNTVQKYWWPAGKTHFSPVKGSLSGNLSVKGNYIGNNYAIKITDAKDRFAIKHLTVQHNRHAAMFASLRGTVSDINFEISSGEWKSWRNGVKSFDGRIAGISTVGDTASGAVIAGDTVTGALIRDCRVGGVGSAEKLSVGHNGIMIGRVDGSLRAGGIVGMLNRGTKIDNCEVAITTSTLNFDKHLDEDVFMKTLEVYAAVGNAIIPVVDAVTFLVSLCRNNKGKTKEAQGELKTINKSLASSQKIKVVAGKTKSGQTFSWSKIIYRILNEIANPLWSLYFGRYGNVCTGSLVGDAYGVATNCNIYVTTKYAPCSLHCGDVFGRANFMSEDPNNIIMATADDGQSGAGVQNGFESQDGGENPSRDVFAAEICDCSVSLDTYLLRNNIKVLSLESLKYGIRGLGTDEEPILVSSEEDLRRIAELMAEGYTFENAYILQTDNIELSDDFECMGLSSRTPFKGVYDGNDCKITGLNIEDEKGAALFYKLDGASICDLKIENGRFTAPVAAALAIYAEDLSVIFNCGSKSVVSSTAQSLSQNTAAAGLVYVLEDSYMANSYAADVVSGMRVAGLVGWIKGESQMAKCYSAVTLDDSNSNRICAGIAFSIEGTSWWEQCYWKKNAGTGTKAFRYVDEGVFEGLSADWADYASTYGLNYTSTSDSDRADERREFALAKTEKTGEYLKSQSFIDSLNNDALSSFIIIDMSQKARWMTGYGMREYNYPGHYVQNAKIRLVQPEYGNLTLKYQGLRDPSNVWHDVEFNEYGYAEIERGNAIRVILNDLPVDKKINYWTINGVPQPGNPGNTFTTRDVSILSASFAVCIGEGTPVQDQTRPLLISETINGVASIEVTDVYAEPGDEPWPSMEFTNPISGEPVFTIGSQNCSVAGDDNSLKSYLGVDYKKLTDQTGKIIYRIEIPYNAIVKVTFTPKNGYQLADYYQNGEKHTVESSSAYVVGPFRMTDSIGLSFFGKAN